MTTNEVIAGMRARSELIKEQLRAEQLRRGLPRRAEQTVDELLAEAAALREANDALEADLTRRDRLRVV